MSKKNGSMLDGDTTTRSAAFDPPGIDMTFVLEAQRRNLEAVAAANRLAFEGTQAVVRRQTEILQQAMGQMAEAAKSLGGLASPQDGALRQAELAREMFQRNLSNMRELAQMVTKANDEAFGVLTRRFSESLDELKGMVDKA